MAYSSQDFAILVPTKDRPQKIRHLLESLIVQTVSCGRIIIVATGQDIRETVMSYAERLPVEYYYSKEPGQILQRNLGIRQLDERTKLVACLDDDIVLLPQALEKMLAFWNQAEPETAGVGFNIVNEKRHQHAFWKRWLLLSVPAAGQVLASGAATSVCNISQSIRSQWLNGGGTVWKQEFLKQSAHREVRARWAVCEDLIFSYPLGKHYPLYVCAEAPILHEHLYDQTQDLNIFRYRGRTQALWQMYFVQANPDLSLAAYFWMTFSSAAVGLSLGALMRKEEVFQRERGRLEGGWLGLRAWLQRQSIIEVIERWT